MQALSEKGGRFSGDQTVTLLPELLRRRPETRFLVDEAFIGLAGQTVAPLVSAYSNLLVTRTSLPEDNARFLAALREL